MDREVVSVNQNKGQTRLFKRNTKRMVFYILMLIIPLLQFCIFYIYANFNSVLLAFQKYEMKLDGLGYKVTFANFDNFIEAGKFFFSARSWEMITHSLKFYLCTLVIGTSLALIFSYYVAKKYLGSTFFRIMLYLPTIISSVVLTLLFKYIVTDVYPIIVKNITGTRPTGLLDGSADMQYNAILVYSLWVSFGANVLLYTSSMSAIDPSIVESAQLDGVTVVQEFLYIYFPMIFPTFTTFVVTGITGIFTNQMNLYTFFGEAGRNKFNIFGFFLYTETRASGLVDNGKTMPYSELAALGLIITIIIIPIVLSVRKLMEKFGPSEE